MPCFYRKSNSDTPYFFFQAEDGIRDTSVTGVQTCALPISRLRSVVTTVSRRAAKRLPAALWVPPLRRRHTTRSEERRVGKGVDPGGRRLQQKKKPQPDAGAPGPQADNKPPTPPHTHQPATT